MKIRTGKRSASAWMLVAALLVPAGAVAAAPQEGAPKGATRFLEGVNSVDKSLKTWILGGFGTFAGLLGRLGLGSSEVPGKAGIDIDPNGAANPLPTPTTDDAGILIDPFG